MSILQNVQKYAKTAIHVLDKNSPWIATGFAVVGAAATLYFSVNGTIKAVKIKEEEQEKRDQEAENKGYEPKPMTKPEIVATCWKCYIPAVLSTAITMGCAIGAQTINARRNAVLVSMLAVSQDKLKRLTESMEKELSTKQIQTIRDKSEEMYTKEHPVKPESVICTGRGEVRIRESITGQEFYSTVEDVNRAVNNINNLLNCEGQVMLGDLLDELGTPNRSDVADHMAFLAEDGLIQIRWSSDMSSTYEPLLVIDYVQPPIYKYRS